MNNQPYCVTRPDKMQEDTYDTNSPISQYQDGKYPADSLVYSDEMNEVENILRGIQDHTDPEQPDSTPPAPLSPQGMPPLPGSVPFPIKNKRQASYYVHTIRGEKGPLSYTDLKELLKNRALTGTTPIREKGTSNWIPLKEVVTLHPIVRKTADLLARWSGTEKINNFNPHLFFGGIFKKHKEQEIVDFFCAGSSTTTPPLNQIVATWPSPWIFARVMLLSILLYFGFDWMNAFFPNPHTIPGLIFAGNFAIPFSILVLFAELNLHRNVPWYGIFKLLLGGGLIALIVTAFLDELFTPQAAYWAGPVEETAKLLATILITRKFYLNGHILTGLLCGAAVGTGFAIFESAGYTFRCMLEDNTLHGTMIARAVLSPFGHIIWTAITAGALWRIMGEKRFSLSMLVQIRFLRIATIPVLLHMFWNFTVEFIPNPLSFLICGLVGWILVLILANEGIRQVRDEQNKHLPSFTSMRS